MESLSVITGGAGGMGLATAKLLGRQRRVLISDINRGALDNAAAQLVELGIRVETAVCDVAERRDVEALAAQARALGRVTSVVHAAGLSPQMGSAQKIVKVNALGTIHVADVFYELAHEDFALVLVASIAGHVTPRLLVPTRAYALSAHDPQKFFARVVARCNLVPGKARPGMAYSVSKNFVIWYARAQSKRFGEKGARIVSVSPGTFDTSMGRLEESHGAGRIVDFGALRRFGRVEEIANVLAFASEAGYLTGADILCDGGVVANIRPRDMLQLAP